MYYVEFLRVFRALRIFAIVLGAVFLIAIGIRLWIGPTIHEQFMKNFSPSATRTVTTDASGVETVVVNDPKKGIRAVQHKSRGGWDLTIYEAPNSAAARAHETGTGKTTQHSDNAGLFQIRETRLPNGGYVARMWSDRHFPFDVLIGIAAFFSAIFATIIGASLSRENDGHLELVWTKPASRERSALTMFAIDLAGIFASMLLIAASCYFTIALYVGFPLLTYTTDSGVNFALSMLFPIAWYALAQGLTASLRRGGLISGLMWVGALLIPFLLGLLHNDIIRAALRTLNTINPLAYFINFSLPGHIPATLLPATHTVNILALSAIIIIAGAASLVQWRRLEA